MKTTSFCYSCKQIKPIDNFYIRKNGKVYSYCNHCNNMRAKSFYCGQPERIRERLKKSKEYQKTHLKTILFKRRLKRKLGLNIKEKIWYNNRFKLQYQNTNFRLSSVLRHRIYLALKGICKSNKTSILLGCSIDQLKQHLKSKFQQGMTWENYGEWHIDHIRPCASFDLSKLEEQKKCFHFSNLQPLLAKDNLAKGDKIL